MSSSQIDQREERQEENTTKGGGLDRGTDAIIYTEDVKSVLSACARLTRETALNVSNVS